jgi:hypothetical protein
MDKKQLEPQDNLETEGIRFLGLERPDLLILICRDTFLPPTQLIYALQALEWYPDKEGLFPALHKLLKHHSKSVANQAFITLGLEQKNGPEPEIS